MAISAAAVWEVRSSASASNVNGGFFVTGASGTDFSQQDTAQFSTSTATTSGAGATILWAAAAASMVGNGLRVVSGTNFTAGWYEVISVVAGVSVTVDRNCCTGIGANGVINVGGALSLGSSDDAVFESLVAGNTMWVKGNATYTLGGTVTIAAAGSGLLTINIVGYNATRGDTPTMSQLPIFDCGIVSFTFGTTFKCSYMAFLTTSGNGTTSGINGVFYRCSFMNNSTTANRFAFGATTAIICIECNFVSYRGYAAFGNAGTFIGCYFHDSVEGLRVTSTGNGAKCFDCLFVNNLTAAFDCTVACTDSQVFHNCTFVNPNNLGTGLLLTAGTSNLRLSNSIITGFATGINHGTANQTQCTDYNNWYYNNTTNATNWTIHSSSFTATDPFFSNYVVLNYTTGTSSNTGNTLTKAGATFITSGVAAGNYVYISASGTGLTGIYKISSVDSETQLTLDLAPGNSTGDVSFTIIAGRNFQPTNTNIIVSGLPGFFRGTSSSTTSYPAIGSVQPNAYSTDPGVANVKTATTYYIAGSLKTGTYDPITGNYTNPGASNVATGTGYTFAGVSITGSYDPITGNYTNPGATHVESGIGYTFAGVSYTGSLVLGNYTDPGSTNVRNGTTYIFNNVTTTGSLQVPNYSSAVAGTVNISNIKESVRYVLNAANTTTGTPIDLSNGLTTRVKQVMKVNPEKIRVDVDSYPCVTIFTNDKSIELKTIARDQATGKRKCEMTFTVVGMVWNDLTTDYKEDSADEDCEILMENVENILRSYDTLGNVVAWQFPDKVTYHSVPYSEDAHFRVGVMDLKATLYY